MKFTCLTLNVSHSWTEHWKMKCLLLLLWHLTVVLPKSVAPSTNLHMVSLLIFWTVCLSSLHNLMKKAKSIRSSLSGRCCLWSILQIRLLILQTLDAKRKMWKWLMMHGMCWQRLVLKHRCVMLFISSRLLILLQGRERYVLIINNLQCSYWYIIYMTLRHLLLISKTSNASIHFSLMRSDQCNISKTIKTSTCSMKWMMAVAAWQ